MHREFEGNKEAVHFDGKAGKDVLKAWVKGESLPPYLEFKEENQDAIFESGITFSVRSHRCLRLSSRDRRVDETRHQCKYIGSIPANTVITEGCWRVFPLVSLNSVGIDRVSRQGCVLKLCKARKRKRKVKRLSARVTAALTACDNMNWTECNLVRDTSDEAHAELLLLPQALLLLKRKDMEKGSKVTTAVKAAAKATKGEVVWVLVDQSGEAAEQITQFFNIKPTDPVPKVLFAPPH
jgi:hypothetical protein